MTPTLLPPSREEPDGTKAPHCCPLTQDHQGPGRERGTGGWKEDGAGMGGGENSVCVCVGGGGGGGKNIHGGEGVALFYKVRGGVGGGGGRGGGGGGGGGGGVGGGGGGGGGFSSNTIV